MNLIHLGTDGVNMGYVHYHTQSQTSTHKPKTLLFLHQWVSDFQCNNYIYFLLLFISKTELYCKNKIKAIIPIPGRLRQQSLKFETSQGYTMRLSNTSIKNVMKTVK